MDSKDIVTSRRTSRQRWKWFKARVRHATLTKGPLWLSRGRLGDAKAVNQIQITNPIVRLPHLPGALRGLRIIHLSDLHVGDLITPKRLPALVAQVNQLEGDLIAVTGDYIDLSLNVIDPVIEAMSCLRAPLGSYFVLGNHDYLDNGPELIRRFKQAGLPLLMDENVVIAHKGCKITIAGIDWSSKPGQLAKSVVSALGTPDQKADLNSTDHLCLLLAHHPNAFETAVNHGVDLTLAGHTHGGQVNLTTRRGRRGSIGLGSLAHRYPHGLYQTGDSYLHVTSGVGSWFPLRVRCPAEIACITLRHAPEHHMHP